MPGSGHSIDKNLSELLAWIDKGELAIPDFQRSFVWPAGNTAELVASIASDFPAGSLLLLENNDQFMRRSFEGAPETGHEPKYLVLDGQQRLTGLYQALYGTGKQDFYIRWKDLLAPDAVFDDDAIAIKKQGSKPRDIDELFPLHAIYGGEGSVHWLLKQSPELQADLETRFRKRWIDSIEKYSFPVVMLPADTPMEAVCTIFETLNRTGIKLTVFELLTAKLRPRGVNLRDNWQDTLERSDIISRFDVTPEDFLRVIGILVNSKDNDAAKPKALLKLTERHIGTFWLKAEEALAQALELLSARAGAYSWRRIPYPALAIPMAASLVSFTGGGAEKGAARQKLMQWFWCSVFSEAYESGQSTKTVSDYRDLMVWLSGGDAPSVVKDFVFEGAELRDVTSGATARYKGILSLLLANRPHDFHNDKEITPERITNREVDDHHVFPRKYLKDAGAKDPADTILNRALIDRETNKRIGANAPRVYIEEIEKKWGKAALKKMLQAHLLPYEPLVRNDYPGFLEQRQRLLQNAVTAAAEAAAGQ